jgi:hypothetical protein
VQTTAETVRLDLLPEKFYVDHRLAHWNGPLLQFVPLRVSVNPLLTQLAVQKNCELSVAARADERFHYEVMRRAAPELVDLPFLDDEWSPNLTGGHASSAEPRRGRYVTPSPARKGWRTLGRRRRRAATADRGKPPPLPRASDGRSATRAAPTNPGWLLVDRDAAGIEQLFERAAHETALGEVCDIERLVGVARGAVALHRSADVKQLFSCIGTVLVLLGESEQVIDRAT